MYLDSESLRHDIGAACSSFLPLTPSHTRLTRVAATSICSAHSRNVSNDVFLSGLCAAVTAGSSSQLNMAADRSSQGFDTGR